MKIAILGAAGVRTPLIVQAMALRQERLGLTELALMDIDPQRLELVGALTAPLEERGELGFTIRRTDQAAEALAGADFVITTFRVGGIESRVTDERVALDLGVLGQETTGPGGFAMAMRTIPVLLNYLEQMRSLCPQAWLINFANPAGLLAEAALRVGGWQRTVGICDAPSTMQRVAAAMLGAHPDEIYLDYFGLNHLGWIRRILYRGDDQLPNFLGMIQQMGGFPELPFAPEMLTELGMIPSEYLHYYYNARQAVANILKKGQTRGEQIQRLNGELFTELRERLANGDRTGMLAAYKAYLQHRGETYMAAETGHSALADLDPSLAEALSGEGYAGVALNLIEALAGSTPRAMILNILNDGAVAGMEAQDCVEIPAMVAAGLVQPLAVGEIPAHCLGLMQQVKTYERLTIEAATETSHRKAVQALAVHPLVADYNLARQLVDGYMARHGDLFPALDPAR